MSAAAYPDAADGGRLLCAAVESMMIRSPRFEKTGAQWSVRAQYRDQTPQQVRIELSPTLLESSSWAALIFGGARARQLR